MTAAWPTDREAMNTIVNRNIPIPERVTELYGFTTRMVEREPDELEAWQRLVENAVATERARCYKIAFEAVATTKDGLHVKASIADAIACGEFEAALR